MNYWFVTIVLVVGLLCQGCKDSSPPPSVKTTQIARLGYVETKHRPDLVNAAISTVNIVLGDDTGILLVSGTRVNGLLEPGAVPVYTIQGARLARSTNCFVPSGERCIIVTDKFIDSLPFFFSPSGSPSTDLERILALILLHECGHIYHGIDGKFTATKNANPQLLNLLSTKSKDSEYQADLFAGTRIKLASEQQENSTRRTEALMLSLKVSELCFDLRGKRAIDNFGATTVGARYVFSDYGYTHPNLELRFLILQNLINPDSNAFEALQDFTKIRTTPPLPVLYRAKEVDDR